MQPRLDELLSQVDRLEAAIRAHRNMRGDDRCYLDDYTLYAALPEGYTPPPYDTMVTLDLCKHYCRARQDPNVHYVSPQREIERLHAGIQYALECVPAWQEAGTNARIALFTMQKILKDLLLAPLKITETALTMSELSGLVPQTYGEAVRAWSLAVITCEPHEWDNRTTAANELWLLQRLCEVVSAGNMPPTVRFKTSRSTDMYANLKTIVAYLRGQAGTTRKAALQALLAILGSGVAQLPDADTAAPQAMVDMPSKKEMVQRLEDLCKQHEAGGPEAVIAIPWAILLPFLAQLASKWLGGAK